MSLPNVYTAKSSKHEKKYWTEEKGISLTEIQKALTYKGVNVERNGKFVIAVINGLSKLQGDLFKKIVEPACKGKPEIADMLREASDIGIEAYKNALLNRASQNAAIKLNSGLPELPAKLKAVAVQDALDF